MTNFEYWKDKILEIVGQGKFGVKEDTPVACSYLSCADCAFISDPKCVRKRFEWLYSEHIKKPKLTKKERQFCELVETGWIARDKNGGLRWWRKRNKPEKFLDLLEWLNGEKFIDMSYMWDTLFQTDILFSFVKWEDSEPWSVEDLLKLEVEE